MKRILLALLLLGFTTVVSAQSTTTPSNGGGASPALDNLANVAINTPLGFGGTTGAFPDVGLCTQETPDAMCIGTSTTSNSLIFSERQDQTFDHAHAATTDPTIFIHSHNQSTTEWISLAHNGTNGVIAVGTGVVSVPGTLNTGSQNVSGLVVAVNGFFINGNNQGFILDNGAINNGGWFRNVAQTPDTAYYETGALGNSLVMGEALDGGFDFAHPQQTNPTLFIQSANQSTTQWIGMAHNQVDAVVSSGTGAIKLSPAAGNIYVTAAAVPTITAGCGAAPSAVVGSNTAGRFTGGTGANISCTITFSVPFVTNAPSCIANDETLSQLIQAVATTTTLVINAATLTSHVVNYICIGT